jgi:tetratricopeptide (TPR) repeat protein
MDEQHQEQRAALPAVAGDELAGLGSQPAGAGDALPSDAADVASSPAFTRSPAAPEYGAGQYPPQPPVYPGYPAPSMPPGQYPSFGQYPTYPGVPSSPSTPFYAPLSAAYSPAAEPQAPQAGLTSILVQPFTAWTSAFVVAGAFLLLALVYTLTELALHGDWAQGGTAVGYAALALAAVAVLGTVLRVALGRKALTTVALGLLLSVALAGSGLGGILLTSPLHHAQAQYLESNGKYEAAIHEYSLSGQVAPNAPDIALAYDEWGESLLEEGSYLEALTRFNVVITQYGESGAPVDRAYQGTFNTYVAWDRTSASNAPYVNAIAFFQSYRGRAGCDAACQTAVQDAEAAARYQYGVALTNQSDFTDAIVQLDAVQAQFPGGQYAAQAHTADAKAYWGLGQQQLTGATCTDAVPTYQTLAAKYADTTQGQQAKSALAAPVTVTGNLIHYPTNPTPTAFLSKHANPAGFFFSDDYTTSVDPHTGKFTFNKVGQGKYNLSTSRPISGGTEFVWWQSNNGNLYTVQVGPLCTVQLPSLSYT